MNTVVTLVPKVNEAILAEVDRLAVGSNRGGTPGGSWQGDY